MAETPVSTSSRRTFSTLAAASSGFLIVKPEQVKGSQANSALTIGLIGCGGRGLHDSGIAAKNEFARIAAICDIYDDRLAEGRKRYSGAKEYKNYKELLSSNLDAVMICTPAFLHPEHFEAAVNAKKHAQNAAAFLRRRRLPSAPTNPSASQSIISNGTARNTEKHMRFSNRGNWVR
jgi:hypothetical protein